MQVFCKTCIRTETEIGGHAPAQRARPPKSDHDAVIRPIFASQEHRSRTNLLFQHCEALWAVWPLPLTRFPGGIAVLLLTRMNRFWSARHCNGYLQSESGQSHRETHSFRLESSPQALADGVPTLRMVHPSGRQGRQAALRSWPVKASNRKDFRAASAETGLPKPAVNGAMGMGGLHRISDMPVLFHDQF